MEKKRGKLYLRSAVARSAHGDLAACGPNLDPMPTPHVKRPYKMQTDSSLHFMVFLSIYGTAARGASQVKYAKYISLKKQCCCVYYLDCIFYMT